MTSITGPGKYSSMSEDQAAGMRAGTQDYARIKRVQDASVQPVKAIRQATDYVGEKYGDIRDSASSAMSGDPKAAEFRAGQRAVRQKDLGYAKGGKFIKGAIKKPGELHRDLHVPQGQKIPAGKLAGAAKKSGKVGQRARLAETLRGLNHSKKD